MTATAATATVATHTPPAIPAELQALSDTSNAAREAWRQQAVLVRGMGDDNLGWGTDLEYRAAARVKRSLWRTYEQAWAAFARAFNAHFGGGVALLDPERAA